MPNVGKPITEICGDRLVQALDNAAAGMALMDIEGNYLRTNAAYRQILCRPELDFRGQTLLTLSHPEDRERYQQQFNQLRSGQHSSFVLEQRYVCPDGQTVWVRNSMSRLRPEGGKPAQFLSICDDITDRKRAERLLLENEKLAMMGLLASSIAHEINNPLEAVTNLLFLIRRAATVEEARQFAAQAESEMARVAEITKHTLRFHREQAEATAVDIVELVQSVLALFQGKMHQTAVRVRLETQDSPHLVCFPGEIRQVVANLVRNAIESMSASGELRVRVRPATDWRTGRKGVRVTIADSGQGMSAEVRRKIYQPFFTTKGSKGTGLGLWISSGILAKHQGSMHVRSKRSPGLSGTAFTLIFPYAGAEGKSADESIAA